jgi:hypothetical protein
MTIIPALRLETSRKDVKVELTRAKNSLFAVLDDYLRPGQQMSPETHCSFLTPFPFAYDVATSGAKNFVSM